MVIHRHRWCWGIKTTIILGGGKALCCVSVDDDDINTAWLHDLLVQEKERGKGYGRALMAQAIKEAKRYGVKQMRLRVDADNWVANWYGRCGFEYIGIDEMIKAL